MALLCGSASMTFPSSSFPIHKNKNATAKSSFVGFHCHYHQSLLLFLLFGPISLKLSMCVVSSRTYRSSHKMNASCLMPEPQFKGPDTWNKTWYPKATDHVNTEKTLYVVDATDEILGRLASTIAIYIRGKNLVTYTPGVDMGAFVVVVNAKKVAVFGEKRTQKLYRRQSGRPGGMKVETFA